MPKGVFVTGIGTGVGKTMVAALLCKSFEADYWKPIQCGSLDNPDSTWVNKMVGAKVHPEKFKLQKAASPHVAAREEDVDIDLTAFSLPVYTQSLVIEGAGGFLVPLNYKGETMRDLMRLLDFPVVLVASYYLGSINHTLLTIESLRVAGIPLAAVIMNGKRMEGTREVIANVCRTSIMLDIPSLEDGNRKTIDSICEKISESDLKKYF
ncbi:MAG: dethiobiotin synthase [Flavobacteriales bacterium]